MSLPHSVAGAGNYILGLVEGLDRLNQAEIYVYCKARDANRFTRRSNSVVVRAIPDMGKARRILWQMFGLKDALHRDAIDLFHATHYIVPECTLSIPVVATIHDLAFFHFPDSYSLHKRLFFQRAIKRAVTRANVLIAVSDTTFRDLQRRFSSLPACYSVPSGFSKPADVKVNDSATAPGFPYLLAVATQEKRKNLPFLLEVFADLAVSFPDLRLILAGQSDNDSRAIRKKITQYCLQERVVTPGYVSEPELNCLYANALAVCVPSYYEGFGFPVLEGMTAGVPVVASDRPAMTELGGVHIRTARCGHHRDWLERLTEILQNPPSTFELEAAATYAKRYSWITTARQMMSIYQEAIEKNIQQWRVYSTPVVEPGHCNECEIAVLKTLAFSDLFDYPLTRKEIYLGLFEYQAEPYEVEQALTHLEAARVIARNEDFYFLRERSGICGLRRFKQQQTIDLLSRNNRMLELICNWPGVHAVALSGAAAFGNCKRDDDIDLFIIAKRRRLWVVCLSLVLLLKLIGKRRIFCLNYSISEDCCETLARNFFIAHQVAHIRPIYNCAELREYIERQSWIYDFLPRGGMQSPIDIPSIQQKRRFRHRVFNSVLFDWVDWLIERFYATYLRRRTRHLDNNSIELSRYKIKLFTNNHIERIAQRFEKRVGELTAKYIRQAPLKHAVTPEQ